MQTFTPANRMENSFGGLLGRFWPLLVLASACCTMGVIVFLPGNLIGWSAIQIVGVAGLLMLILLGTLVGTDRLSKRMATTYRMGLALWWFLVVLEQFFPRRGTSDTVYAGEVALSAYGEAIIWGLIAIILVLIGVTRLEYLRGFFTGQFKWLSIFAVVCVLSAPLSHSLSFSLAWAFKLCLAVVLLRMLFSTMETATDVRRFLRVNLWAFLLLALLAVGQAVMGPGGPFGWTTYQDVGTTTTDALGRATVGDSGDADVRLNAIVHPVTVSEWSAIALLLGMVLYSLERRRKFLVIAVVAMIIMVVAGGKAAILSGLLSTILFFAFQKKLGKAIAVGIALGIVTFALVLASPLSEHLRHYANAGEASTLTGRTELWAIAVPEIEHKFLLGHGFMASRWVAEQIETPWDAGHLHNGFLEVLYNNGIVGLVPILFIHWLIISNLFFVMKRRPSREVMLMAAGLLALYVNFLLNGMVEVVWGGRPSSFFMLFLALLVTSAFLRRIASSFETSETPA